MITDDRARELAAQCLAAMDGQAPAPDLSDYDISDAQMIAAHMTRQSGRSIALVSEPDTGRSMFMVVDVLSLARDQALDELIERWAAKEDGDEEGEQ